MKKTSNINRYLGVFTDSARVYLITHARKDSENHYFLDSSSNGLKFDEARKPFLITTEGGKIENISDTSDFKISELGAGKYLLFYNSLKSKSSVFYSTSLNLFNWMGSRKVTGLSSPSVLVPEYKYQDKYVCLTGEDEISIAYSFDLTSWEVKKEPLLTKRGDNFDADNLVIGGVRLNPDGILVFYFSKKMSSSKWYMGTALFDRENPEKLLYRSRESLWEEEEEFVEKEISPVGVVVFRGRLMVYFSTAEGKLYAFSLNFYKQSPAFSKPFPSFLVKKFKDNPIISPIIHHFWESKATFNPGAVYEGGKVHLLYRAVGDSDSSVLGYAASSDGLNIDERSDAPVYVPTAPFECGDPGQSVFNVPYLSGGGGNGGCEDPKLCVIDDRIYMTYVAFSGKSYPGVALTSISTEDFLNQKWNWDKPTLISHPNEMHKNWVLFPEKIDGKFAILHNLLPNIAVSYIEDLKDLEGDNYVESWNPRNYWSQSHARYFWDSHVRGPGPPPLKTKLGWLLLYHAMDFRDYDKYKVGAMILDSKNPEKIIYRSRAPVMEPDKPYENNGYKAGVVYSCGAVIKDEDLLIYYGGADKFVCAAKANLDELLNEVKRSEVPELTPVYLKKANG